MRREECSSFGFAGFLGVEGGTYVSMCSRLKRNNTPVLNFAHDSCVHVYLGGVPCM